MQSSGAKYNQINFQKIMLAVMPVKSGLRSYGGLPRIGTPSPEESKHSELLGGDGHTTVFIPFA